MSTIRFFNNKICNSFEDHKKNSDSNVLIEIYDREEEQKFFVDKLTKLTKKLYNLYNNDKFELPKKIKMKTNKAVYISVWENKPIVSASNLTNLLKSTDHYFGACDEFGNKIKRISWEEFNYKYGGEDLLGKLVYLEDVKEEIVWVYWTDLFDSNDIKISKEEIIQEEENELESFLGFCRSGAISKKKNIFWELQLFAFIRSFKDGITFFNFDINWNRFVSEHTPSFKIEFTIFNIFNSIHIYKNNY